MMYSQPMRCRPIKQKDVLITGCSSGIGRATAHRLRADGWRVFPTARKPEDLAGLRNEGFDPIALDLLDSRSIEQAVDEAQSRSEGRLTCLVNNAGFGQAGAMEDLSRETMRAQFEVNVFGLQELTNRLLPRMRALGEGRIINISSVLGRVTLPYLGCYSGSKHALESFTDAMRIELGGSGIGVVLIEPGPIATEFRTNLVTYAQENLTLEKGHHTERYQADLERRGEASAAQSFFTLPPAAVAKVVSHALSSNRPRRRYRVTWPAHLGEWLRRFAPDAVIDAAMKLQAKS